MKEIQGLVQVVKDIVQNMGYVYWGIEFSNFGTRTKLCVFIDSQDGISLDDCESVSNQLSSVFGVEDVIKGAYVLEISSPGLDRPLFEINQYREYVGSEVKVMTYKSFQGSKNFVGRLNSVKDNTIALDTNDSSIEIPFSSIRKAKLVYKSTDGEIG